MTLEDTLRRIIREEVRAALAELPTAGQMPALGGAVQAMTVAQAAEALNCSRGSIYRLLASGKVRSICVGRSRRVLCASLDQLLLGGNEPEAPERAARAARRLRAVGGGG